MSVTVGNIECTLATIDSYVHFEKQRKRNLSIAILLKTAYALYIYAYEKFNMEVQNKVSLSDDEEDLEALRLAALQSLKKKDLPNDPQQTEQSNFAPSNEYPCRSGSRSHRGFPNKRGRFFGARGTKNGQFFNSRVRSSNLISITPVGLEEDKPSGHAEGNTAKLILPQDRYCNKDKSEEKLDETSSKFDRYNNSDESDEESEDELSCRSEDDSPGKLERSDSLEALMKELDDEIQGKSKTKEKEDKPKVKTKSKRKKEALSDDKAVIDKEVTELKEQKSDTLSSVVEENEPKPKKRRIAPVDRKQYHRSQHFHGYNQPPFLASLPVPFPSLGTNTVPLFNPNLAPPHIVMMPPFYDRPLSPLTINADTLQTQTLAPLSPRSAAFVLENRAIVEKRKRSPKRSFSRSPSPRSRSLTPRSPRRSLTPRRRSRSPKRRTPPVNQGLLVGSRSGTSPKPKRRSLTPKRRTPSPRRRSLSPRRRSMSPKRISKKDFKTSPKLKVHIKERLGLKGNSKAEPKTEKDKNSCPSPKKEEKQLDPVLEARKRKFESNEIRVKEGVIKLKPKEQPVEKEETDESKVTEIKSNELKPDAGEEEEALLGDDELDLEAKVHLFSDEDSGSENEGRFKEKEHNNVKPPILPFSKLVNGTKTEVKKNDKIKKDERKESEKSKSTSKKENEPKKSSGSKDVSKKTKSRIVLKSNPKKFERKIEIKIKNPSKYEKDTKSKQSKDPEVKIKDKVSNKLIKKDDDEYESLESDVEKDGETEVASCSEGDLRAQLSKKRAEKMNKIVAPEQVTSRLLQNALQNALQKSSRSKSQEFSNSDGKLPIHLRLGLASHTDGFSKPKRKSRKRKNRDVVEQV